MLARGVFAVNAHALYAQPKNGLFQALCILVKKLADKFFTPEAGWGFISRAPNMGEKALRPSGGFGHGQG